MNVEENGFFSNTVMIDRSDNVLAAIFQLDSIDDESVIIASIALHEFDTLLEFAVIVSPGDGRWCDSDNAAIEFSALSFVGES